MTIQVKLKDFFNSIKTENLAELQKSIDDKGKLYSDLLKAIDKGWLEKVKELIDGGLDFNKSSPIEPSQNPEKFLANAAYKNHNEIFKYLLFKLDNLEGIIKNDKFFEDILIVSTRAEPTNLELIKYLGELGVNLNFNNGRLLRDAASFDLLEATNYLIDYGCNINTENGSILMAAAMCGALKVIPLLLNRGADIQQSLNNPIINEDGTRILNKLLKIKQEQQALNNVAHETISKESHKKVKL